MSIVLPQPRPSPAPTAAVAADSLVALLAARVAATADRTAVVDPLAGGGVVRRAVVGGQTPLQGAQRPDIGGQRPPLHEVFGGQRPPLHEASGGQTPLQGWTWVELAAAALDLADRLEAAGFVRGDRVAHVGGHGPDWMAVDLACLLAGFVHVALHDEPGPEPAAAGLEWLGLRGSIASGGRRPLRTGGPSLDAAGMLAARCGRGVDHEMVRGRLERRLRDCDPDAPCTIVLSSGTTGLPHGVVHAQRGLAANARAASAVFLDDPRDVRLAWLPMSHALARTGDLYTAIVRGGCLSVVGDRSRVLDACAALPPTVILGVPAFFERLEGAVRAGRITDLRAALGGAVRTCISGGAALRRRTADCFAAAGVPLVEGYGLAEAGPVVALSNPRIARPGTVGPPLEGIELAIDDRDESRGQLLVRTPSRGLGVVRPAASAAARAAGPAPVEPLPEWLPTGDLAVIDADGHLRITGRASERVVLSTGVKLPPAEVERALAEDAAVAQVCVVGDGLRFPVALVVPEPAAVRRFVKRLGLRVFSRRAALGHPRVVGWMARRLARRQRTLPATWRVRRVVLVGRPFDAARGEATPSFKLKRSTIAGHFAGRIAAAAAEPPPRWVGRLPTGESEAREGGMQRASWMIDGVWATGAHRAGGFAAAAATAAAPVRGAVSAVLDRAERELARLRLEGRLYDPVPNPAGGSAPLADAPPPPTGLFSAAAEEALGAAGLWGLAVPAAFGGTGASVGELSRAITRVAADCPTAAGMLAVHSSIGAVSAVVAFGSDEQRRRHLPDLARGRPLSIFGGTEPEVGCDLASVHATLERHAGGLRLTGTKMFITGATHGRVVKILARLDGRPAVALVRLPDADGPTFRLRHYPLHPLRHAHNAALEFTAFPVAEADLLAPPPGRDGMAIVWHGLNRGRVSLAAQAAGTLRLMLRHAVDHARLRHTWGRPIAARELVQGRLARIAAGIAACDAVTAWAAAAIDAGQTGELEAIAAKVTASECVRQAAIDALGVHGGRAFLVGHPLGDSFHDHFAVTVYEGESDLLGLALFKGLAKGHPLAAQVDAPGLRRAGGWLAWRAAMLAVGGTAAEASIADHRLRSHALQARTLLAAAAVRIDRAIRRHGRRLADRQLDVGALAAEVRELVGVLAVAHHAAAAGGDVAAADCWCRLAVARATGRRPTAADHAALAALGRTVAAPITAAS